jgi:hypothetical protein
LRKGEGMPYSVWIAWVWNYEGTHKISMKVLSEMYGDDLSPAEAVREYEKRNG